MAFTRRFTETPPVNVITEIEGIVVVDQTPPGVSLGVGTGKACCVAEFLKGPFHEPTEILTGGQLISQFGGFSRALSLNGAGVDYNGNGFVSLRSKTFKELVVVRADNRAVTTGTAPPSQGGTASQLELHVSATNPASLPTADKNPQEFVIPAGTMFISDPGDAIIALAQDVTVPEGAELNAANVEFNELVDVFFVKDTAEIASATWKLITDVEDLTIAGAASLPAALPSLEGRPGTPTFGTSVVQIDSATTNASAMAKPDLEVAYAGSGSGATAQGAIQSTLPVNPPVDDVAIIWSARRTIGGTTIQAALRDNAIDSSAVGQGRTACIPADPAATADPTGAAAAITAAIALADNVAVGLSDRTRVAFPNFQLNLPELGAVVTVPSDSLLAVSLSNFPPEYNIGQENPYIQNAISNLEEAFVKVPLTLDNYIALRAGSVTALIRDKGVGWQFQSDVTTVDPVSQPSLVPGKRRRMADFIQDSLAAISAKYSKKAATTQRIDALIADHTAFLKGLLSEDNPAFQRIEQYLIDPVSGNTAENRALGIFVIQEAVRLLGSLDFIVLQTTIGESVDVTTLAA